MAVYDMWKVGRGPNKGQLKPPEQRRAGKRWRVVYRDPETGKTCEHFEDIKTDAEAYDAKKRHELATGTYVDDKAGKQLVSVYGPKWIAVQALRPSSLESYERVMRLHIAPTLGHLQMLAVRRSNIQAWVKKMQDEGYANNTVRMWYSIVAGMFKASVHDRVIGMTPCVKIKLPPKTKKRVFIPSQFQVTALARAIVPWFRLAVYLASACGLRWSEIFGLTEEDFDFAEEKIYVRRALAKRTGEKACLTWTKTKNSVRDVDLPNFVAKLVKEHIATGYGRTMIMPDETVRVKPGRPTAEREARLMFDHMWRTDWSDYWHRAIARTGDVFADAPKDFTMHDLRHRYVSFLIESGASLIEVQAAVGHADGSTTLNVYGHLWPTSEGRAKKLIDAAFDGYVTDLVA
jgi:integrase